VVVDVLVEVDVDVDVDVGTQHCLILVIIGNKQVFSLLSDLFVIIFIVFITQTKIVLK